MASQSTTGSVTAKSPAKKPAAHCKSDANRRETSSPSASTAVTAESGSALLARVRNAAAKHAPMSAAGPNSRSRTPSPPNARSAAYNPMSVGRLVYSSVRLPPPTSEQVSAR